MTSPTVADFHKLQRDVADAAAHIRKMEGSNAELRSLMKTWTECEEPIAKRV